MDDPFEIKNPAAEARNYAHEQRKSDEYNRDSGPQFVKINPVDNLKDSFQF